MAATRIPGRLPRNTSLNSSQLAACLSIKPQAISDFMRKTDPGQSMNRMDLFMANGWIITQGRAKVFTPEGVLQFAKLHGDVMDDTTAVVIDDYRAYNAYNQSENEKPSSGLEPESVYAELILSQRKQIAELTEEVEQLRNKTAEMQLLLDQPSVPQEQYEQVVGERDAALERITQMEASQQNVQQANCDAITSINALTEHLDEVREENAALNRKLSDEEQKLTEAEQKHAEALRHSEAQYKAELEAAEQAKREALEAAENAKREALAEAERRRQQELQALQAQAEQERIAAADEAEEHAKNEFRRMGFFRRLFWRG